MSFYFELKNSNLKIFSISPFYEKKCSFYKNIKSIGSKIEYKQYQKGNVYVSVDYGLRKSFKVFLYNNKSSFKAKKKFFINLKKDCIIFNHIDNKLIFRKDNDSFFDYNTFLFFKNLPFFDINNLKNFNGLKNKLFINYSFCSLKKRDIIYFFIFNVFFKGTKKNLKFLNKKTSNFFKIYSKKSLKVSKNLKLFRKLKKKNEKTFFNFFFSTTFFILHKNKSSLLALFKNIEKEVFLLKNYDKNFINIQNFLKFKQKKIFFRVRNKKVNNLNLSYRKLFFEEKSLKKQFKFLKYLNHFKVGQKRESLILRKKKNNVKNLRDFFTKNFFKSKFIIDYEKNKNKFFESSPFLRFFYKPVVFNLKFKDPHVFFLENVIFFKRLNIFFKLFGSFFLLSKIFSFLGKKCNLKFDIILSYFLLYSLKNFKFNFRFLKVFNKKYNSFFSLKDKKKFLKIFFIDNIKVFSKTIFFKKRLKNSLVDKFIYTYKNNIEKEIIPLKINSYNSNFIFNFPSSLKDFDYFSTPGIFLMLRNKKGALKFSRLNKLKKKSLVLQRKKVSFFKNIFFKNFNLPKNKKKKIFSNLLFLEAIFFNEKKYKKSLKKRKFFRKILTTSNNFDFFFIQYLKVPLGVNLNKKFDSKSLDLFDLNLKNFKKVKFKNLNFFSSKDFYIRKPLDFLYKGRLFYSLGFFFKKRKKFLSSDKNFLKKHFSIKKKSIKFLSNLKSKKFLASKSNSNTFLFKKLFFSKDFYKSRKKNNFFYFKLKKKNKIFFLQKNLEFFIKNIILKKDLNKNRLLKVKPLFFNKNLKKMNKKVLNFKLDKTSSPYRNLNFKFQISIFSNLNKKKSFKIRKKNFFSNFSIKKYKFFTFLNSFSSKFNFFSFHNNYIKNKRLKVFFPYNQSNLFFTFFTRKASNFLPFFRSVYKVLGQEKPKNLQEVISFLNKLPNVSFINDFYKKLKETHVDFFHKTSLAKNASKFKNITLNPNVKKSFSFKLKNNDKFKNRNFSILEDLNFFSKNLFFFFEIFFNKDLKLQNFKEFYKNIFKFLNFYFKLLNKNFYFFFKSIFLKKNKNFFIFFNIIFLSFIILKFLFFKFLDFYIYFFIFSKKKFLDLNFYIKDFFRIKKFIMLSFLLKRFFYTKNSYFKCLFNKNKIKNLKFLFGLINTRLKKKSFTLKSKFYFKFLSKNLNGNYSLKKKPYFIKNLFSILEKNFSHKIENSLNNLFFKGLTSFNLNFFYNSFNFLNNKECFEVFFLITPFTSKKIKIFSKNLEFSLFVKSFSFSKIISKLNEKR